MFHFDLDSVRLGRDTSLALTGRVLGPPCESVGAENLWNGPSHWVGPAAVQVRVRGKV
jgi:hypothetical protein